MSKEKSLQETLDERSEDIAERLRKVASASNLSVMDIYNLVMRAYKTDNGLREQVMKNQELQIEQKRIELDGRKFLIDEYNVAQIMRKIQRKEKRAAWFRKFTFKNKANVGHPTA